MKALALSIFVAISLPACAGTAGLVSKDEQLEAEGSEAIEAEDFGRAIEMVLPLAHAGDSEAEFTVGYLGLLWLEAEAPREPPKYTLEESVTWIRKAAAKGLPQAAGFLRSGYEWGRYSLPKNPTLEACWRKVELAEQRADICLAAEKQESAKSGAQNISD